MSERVEEIGRLFVLELWAYGMNGIYNSKRLVEWLRSMGWIHKERVKHLGDKRELCMRVHSHKTYSDNIAQQCQTLYTAGCRWRDKNGLGWEVPAWDEDGLPGLPCVFDIELDQQGVTMHDYICTDADQPAQQAVVANQARFTRDVLLAANRVEYHGEKLERIAVEGDYRDTEVRLARGFMPVVNGARLQIGTIAKECMGHNEFNIRWWMGERFTNAEQFALRNKYVDQLSFGAGAAGTHYAVLDPAAAGAPSAFRRPTYDDLEALLRA